jgi:uncharacterized protein
MSVLDLLIANLLSPVVLFFALGVIATLVRSDLELPQSFITALSIYLLAAIGLKGGVALSITPLSQLTTPIVGTLALGVAIPCWSYAVMRYAGRFSVADSAAVAAHYGSCSVVTFITAMQFLKQTPHPAEGYLPALVAILEVPAIVIALLIARLGARTKGSSWGAVLHEAVSGRSVLLLVGGLIIGYVGGEKQFEKVHVFFSDAFLGILCLFMLELGIKCALRLGDLKKVGLFLIAFGILMPIFNGVLGVWVGQLCGMTVGSATALGVLSASASYIAAPAAVRVALPEANPTYYLTSSLAITFPFNLAVGIPLFYAVAKWMFGG